LAITYNVLNLQQSLSQNGTTVASYTWLADGTKCAVVDNTANGYDYLGSLIYIRSGSVRTLESAACGGGRFVNTNNTILPYYYITDHLGSTRVITDNSGSVVERNDYYPFGGKHANSSYAQLTTNKQKFNGKELQTTGNTGFLDYGARMYDDVIGRWGVVDPLVEKYYSISPYAYCENNPSRLSDPDGCDLLDKIVGATVAFVDNATGLNLRGSYTPTDAADYNVGQDLGDIGSVLAGIGEADTGAGIAAGSVVLTGTTVGLSIEVTGPTFIAGTAIASHGTFMVASGVSNFATQKGRISESNKEVNGNSKSSTKGQHNYDIKDTKTGNVVKTGTSGGKETKNGESYRGNSQANKWNKQEGTPGRYESETTNRVPPGRGARQSALDYEKTRANQVRDQLDPTKHKRP